MGGTRKNSSSDDVFDGFLDDAAHGASTHFGVVTFFNENLFGARSKIDGDFLWFESFVGGSDDKVENSDKVLF